MEADRHHFFEIPLPPTWCEGTRRERSISVAFALTPEVRTTRLDYRATKLRFSFGCADDYLDDVAAVFRRDADEGIAERGSNRWISRDKRNSGTLQVSRWGFLGRIAPERLFVVVTRQDAAWSPVSDQAERYALCVVLEDWERADVNLYAEVRAVLQANPRVRVKV